MSQTSLPADHNEAPAPTQERRLLLDVMHAWYSHIYLDPTYATLAYVEMVRETQRRVHAALDEGELTPYQIALLVVAPVFAAPGEDAYAYLLEGETLRPGDVPLTELLDDGPEGITSGGVASQSA